MGACDVEAKTDFEISQSNTLVAVTTELEEMIEGQRADSEEVITEMRKAAEGARQILRRPTISWQYPNPAENVLFNLWLDHIVNQVTDLETRVQELEQIIANVSDSARTLFEAAGNPQALEDVARLLREGVSQMAVDLADETTLAKLAADNRWRSEAANAYAESAQRQTDEGLDVLAEAAESLAVFLDEHSITETDFWDEVGELISEFHWIAVGLYVSGIGVALSAAGVVLAAPTAGISLLISIAGLVVSCIGWIISAVGAWKFMEEVLNLIPRYDERLDSGLSTMNSQALEGSEVWPVLAR